jgi:hypothetical protein
MTFVHLTSTCSVDPNRVESVFIQPQSFENGPEAVIVSMQNGDKFRVDPSYNESPYKTKDKVLTKLSEAEA